MLLLVSPVDKTLIIAERLFSNSLLIHQVKTKKITTVRRFGCPDLTTLDFDDFTSQFTPSFCFNLEDISTTLDSVSLQLSKHLEFCPNFQPSLLGVCISR